MENNLQNREVSYKEMQEMLPDYVFGRLEPDDIQLFEYFLPNYPDLQDEIKQVKAVFSRVEKMDLDKKISQKTRNLSIKVLDRMDVRTEKQKRFSLTTKYIVPSLGLAIVIILIFFINPNNKNSNIGNEAYNSNANNFQILENKDALALFDSSVGESDYLALSTNLASENIKELSNPGVDDVTANTIWEEFIVEHLASSISGSERQLVSSPDYQQYNLMNELNNMEEKDFQNILEEISNVKFNI
jgi:hypothetical protein